MLDPHDVDILQEVEYYMVRASELFEEKFTVSLSVGTLATIFGIDAAMLLCISLLMCADLFFGILHSWKAHTFSLYKLQRGAMKFLAYYLSMLLVNNVNDYVSRSLGVWLPVQNLYVTYLIATEGLSIMSHCSQLGMPFPPLFRVILRSYQNKVEKTVQAIVKSDTPKDDIPKDDTHEQ